MTLNEFAATKNTSYKANSTDVVVEEAYLTTKYTNQLTGDTATFEDLEEVIMSTDGTITFVEKEPKLNIEELLKDLTNEQLDKLIKLNEELKEQEKL